MSQVSGQKKGKRPPDMTEVKKSLLCEMCSLQYKDPRLLSCLHTFCFACLKRYVDKNKFKGHFPCPLCKRSIEMPKTGLKALPTNVYLSVVSQQDKPTAPTCDVCETGNKAAERCLECEENMCDSCLTFHYKLKTTRTHRTAPVNNQQTKGASKILHKQFCDKHETEELKFFCVPCGKSICRDCKTLLHNSHQIKEISEIAQERKRDIGKALRHTKVFLPKIQSHLEALQNVMKNLEKSTQVTTRTIKNQAKAMHTEIDRIAGELVSEIREKNKDMENKIQTELSKSQTLYASMDSVILAAESFMNVGSDHDVIENSKNIKIRVENLANEIPSESVDFQEFRFNPGPIPSVDIWTVFGHWTSEVSNTLAISIPNQMRPALALVVREVNSFHVLEDKTVIAIAPTSGGNAWVCHSLSDKVFQCSRNSKLNATVHTGFEIGDLFVAADSSVLMSFPTQKKIRRLMPNLKIGDYASLPLFPAGLCQTDSGDVLVCGMNQLQESIKSPVSKGSVLRISNYGRIERFDKDKENIFERPIRIALNYNKDIIVCDWARGSDHVVCLASDGNMKWKYFGPKSKDKKTKYHFVPNAIACDKYLQVLIADSPNKCVHLLDENGRFLRMLVTENDGIGEPWALTVDSEGYLWIGDANGKITVFRYMS